MVNIYIPEKGDIVWLDFDSQAGREMNKRRPSVVISPSDYNAKTSLFIVCPITSRIKGYPFEISIPKNLTVSGVVLADQLKSLDWKTRRAELADKLPWEIFNKIIDTIQILLYKGSDKTELSQLFDDIFKNFAGKTPEKFSLVTGSKNNNGYYTQAITLIGHLIGQAKIIEQEEFGNPGSFFTIFKEEQYLYYSPSDNRILLHLITNYEILPFAELISDLSSAKIIEVRNIRSFIERYPSLGKKCGLPVPLPPDILPIDEVNIDFI